MITKESIMETIQLEIEKLLEKEEILLLSTRNKSWISLVYSVEIKEQEYLLELTKTKKFTRVILKQHKEPVYFNDLILVNVYHDALQEGLKELTAKLKMYTMYLESDKEWLFDRTVLLAVQGSYAYGTNTEDSDYDFRGVCTPPIDYYLGLNAMNEYKNTSGRNFLGVQQSNTPEDVDLVVWHMNKFVKDAFSGRVENILLLCTPIEDFIRVTSIGEELLAHRHLFLTKQIRKTFGGFSTKQLKLMKKKMTLDTNKYDTKLAMYCVMFLQIAIEVAEKGIFSTRRDNTEELLKIKAGEYTFNEIEDWVKELEQQMEIAYENTTLPEMADQNAVNDLAISVNLWAIKQELREFL